MPRLSAVAALVAACFATSTSHAAPWAPASKKARQLLNAGSASAERGDFNEGARLALASFALEPSTGAHWIAGQAYAWAGDWRHALERFDLALADPDLPRDKRKKIEPRRQLARAFVDADDLRTAGRWSDARAAYTAILASETPDDTDRARASEALALVEREQATADERARAAATEEAQTTAAAAEARERAAPPVNGGPVRAVDAAQETSSTAPPPPAEQPSRWHDTTAIVLAGVGAVGVGVGIWLYARGQDLDAQARREPDEGARISLTDRAANARTGAAIAAAAGGALLVAGAVKWAIPADAPRPTLATVAPTSGGAVVVVGGWF